MADLEDQDACSCHLGVGLGELQPQCPGDLRVEADAVQSVLHRLCLGAAVEADEAHGLPGGEFDERPLVPLKGPEEQVKCAELCPLEPPCPISVPFEERGGAVPCGTPWGRWYQALEEVFIEVCAKDERCSLGSRDITLATQGRELLQSKLSDSTVTDEGTWTLEDRQLIRIVLTKTNRDAGNCWTSLLENEYAADPWVQDQMQRKLTLERFQRENPGFDFSGAEISGNYSKGGPDFSSLEK
ncbi:LOW QUALITY PROTEIN: nudC domain-containing protein 2-like [Pseudopipra pipra]|uniref:LOW QUALITY PROTEIN: nudC domain-containing protein 2-like n=1 Tax=Pseudopipra pipra TaxID=415032 RepID=UPI0031389FF8